MHSLSHCYGLLTALVLLNSVARWCNAKQFLQKLCNFTCLCAWASEGSFPGRTLVDFSKSFSRGAKSGEICILPHSKLRKEPFLLKFSNFWIHSDTHALVSKKVHATPSKLSCNFKRFNTILNSEIVLNLIGKIKYLTDQFQLCFCFYIGNTKLSYLFLHWQHNWHPYSRQLASCCICFVLSLRSCVKRNFWLHAICACTEWCSAHKIRWENWWLELRV